MIWIWRCLYKSRGYCYDGHHVQYVRVGIGLSKYTKVAFESISNIGWKASLCVFLALSYLQHCAGCLWDVCCTLHLSHCPRGPDIISKEIGRSDDYLFCRPKVVLLHIANLKLSQICWCKVNEWRSDGIGFKGRSEFRFVKFPFVKTLQKSD